MKMKSECKACFYGALLVVLASCSSSKTAQKHQQGAAYIPVDKALYATIIQQDSTFFAAFNARNLNGLQSYFTDKLEVFQDNTGVRNYDETMQAFAGLFKMDYVLNRQPILESIEVFPIKNYGAIETGKHTFCHTENGKYECATFRFVHIWANKNGQWKIEKIITYDHKM